MLTNGAILARFEDEFKPTPSRRRIAIDAVLLREHRNIMRDARLGILHVDSDIEDEITCVDCGGHLDSHGCPRCDEPSEDWRDDLRDYEAHAANDHRGDSGDDGDDYGYAECYVRDFDLFYNPIDFPFASPRSPFESPDEMHAFLAHNGGAHLDQAVIAFNDENFSNVSIHELTLSDYFWNHHENGEDNTMDYANTNPHGRRQFIELNNGRLKRLNGRRGGHGGSGQNHSKKVDLLLRDRVAADEAELDEFLTAQQRIDDERRKVTYAATQAPAPRTDDGNGKSKRSASGKSKRSKRKGRRQPKPLRVVEVFVMQSRMEGGARSPVLSGRIAVMRKGSRLVTSHVAIAS